MFPIVHQEELNLNVNVNFKTDSVQKQRASPTDSAHFHNCLIIGRNPPARDFRREFRHLLKFRKRKRLTDCLEILAMNGIQGDEAILILTILGGAS